jgi:hypothetical protein
MGHPPYYLGQSEIAFQLFFTSVKRDLFGNRAVVKFVLENLLFVRAPILCTQ